MSRPRPFPTLEEWDAIVNSYAKLTTRQLLDELVTLTSKIAEIHAILEDRVQEKK